MKKFLLFLLFFASIGICSAQETPTDEKINKINELKVNGLMLTLGAVEVTYEHLLNEEAGLGISIFIPFDTDLIRDLDYTISPYYRFYFGDTYAAGFFVEGFGMLNSSLRNKIFFYDNEGNLTRIEEIKKTDVALGIGVGGKWVTHRGMFAEVNIGVGRNLIHGDDSFNQVVGRLGISIGLRF